VHSFSPLFCNAKLPTQPHSGPLPFHSPVHSRALHLRLQLFVAETACTEYCLIMCR
jgi:hypothetical protein